MLEIGTQLGPYKVLGRLGAGGMGEVLLALDTRLGREVALKTLPREFSQDSIRLARFRQEALTLAALNHPNIATIYGFEEPEPGSLLLVLERIEGKSLAERLGEGSLAYEEGLQICAQVAEALEVAHERGVIHRDLKPSNVMLGPRGIVKVVDFGLARAAATAAEAHGAAESGKSTGDVAKPAAPAKPVAPAKPAAPAGDGPPTMDSGATVDLDPATLALETRAGLDATVSDDSAIGPIQGTPGYMSPEQIRDGAQDERTDIFAFGSLLYECLAGKRAFLGENLLETITATLEQEPDWSRLPARTAGRVRELLAQTLEKEPDRRLAEIRSARVGLEEVLGIRRASALRTGEAVATPHNLPKALTTFVGRETEVQDCAKLLGECRLLTLTGVGCRGKTWLALRVAEDSLTEFPDGVWFVDLAPVTDPERVEVTVAVAMGVREEPTRSLTEALLEHLAGRRTLILLDNCEHVLRSAAGLASLLLVACPEVKLMATSREALGVDGERLRPVPALAIPSKAKSTSASAIEGFEAVRLFVERAKLVQPGFGLSDANAPPIAEICRRLDGIPLAIELAAARIKILGPDEIRAKLDDRFRLLTGGSRTALPRQQTLRATLQWSVDQLLPREQELMRRFSVFAGGWTLESATAVVDEDGDEFEVLDVLTRLADKSLVVVDRSDASRTRYRFLETVREFASEMLRGSGEADPVRNRHLAFFLSLAETAEPRLTGPEQGQWLRALDDEQENLLGALAFAPESQDGSERALRLGGAAFQYWSARGLYEVGRRALDAALTAGRKGPPTAALAKGLVRAGGLAVYQNDYTRARPLIEESLVIYRTLDDRKGIARSLSGLSVVATYQGDFSAARTFAEEGLVLYRELGALRGAALELHNLGYIALCEGDLARAHSAYEESLALLRQLGDQAHTAFTLVDLAVVAIRSGGLEDARTQLTEALHIVRELTAKREAVYALEGVAELAIAGGDPGSAARLWGAALGIREAIGAPLVASEQRERDRLVEKMAGELGPEGFALQQTAGQGLALEDAIDQALGWMGSMGRG